MIKTISSDKATWSFSNLCSNSENSFQVTVGSEDLDNEIGIWHTKDFCVFAFINPIFYQRQTILYLLIAFTLPEAKLTHKL